MWALELVDYPTLQFVIFILGCHEGCFYSVCAFKVNWYSFVLHVLLNFSPSQCLYGTTMQMFLLFMLLLDPLLLLLLVGWLSMELGWLLVWCLCSNFCCSLFKVHVGKWQACRAILCGQVPCVEIAGYVILLWPCVPRCCKHCVWPQWSDYCPSIDIGLYTMFPVNCSDERVVGTWCKLGVQEWKWSILVGLFHCELYVEVLCVHML